MLLKASNKDLMAIKAIILDFDGVVVESNDIKHQAFSEIFKEFPDHYDEMMAYHRSHNHTGRYDKFKYICKNILKGGNCQKFAEKMTEKFTGLTREKIIKSPYVKGSLEFIRHFSGKIPLYIASATPLDELLVILSARGLLRYFKGVYGVPMPKTEMFKAVIEKENVSPAEVLFIGDSPEDQDAAKTSGISFVARMSDYDFRGRKVKQIGDLNELRSLILEGAG